MTVTEEMQIRKLFAAVLCTQLSQIGAAVLNDIRSMDLRALSISDIPLCGVGVQISITF